MSATVPNYFGFRVAEFFDDIAQDSVDFASSALDRETRSMQHDCSSFASRPADAQNVPLLDLLFSFRRALQWQQRGSLRRSRRLWMFLSSTVPETSFRFPRAFSSTTTRLPPPPPYPPFTPQMDVETPADDEENACDTRISELRSQISMVPPPSPPPLMPQLQTVRDAMAAEGDVLAVQLRHFAAYQPHLLSLQHGIEESKSIPPLPPSSPASRLRRCGNPSALGRVVGASRQE
jgi:hypothetical protein